MPSSNALPRSSTGHVVFKYALDPVDDTQHSIPAGSHFLDLQVQDGVPVMWWSVPADPDVEPLLRTFTIVPTGFPGTLDDLLYVGTFQLGAFVGHVFAWEPLDG